MTGITLSASDQLRYEGCRRRYVLEKSWLPLRWRPKSLWDSCLREAVLSLSTAIPVEAVRRDARTRFLDQCASPGLDLPPGVDSWTIAQEWAGMLTVVLTAIARQPLPRLRKLPQQDLTTDEALTTYLPLSFSDDSMLHRWISCDSWTTDELVRQGHSWHTLGDMAAADMPMTLHVVEIGRTRNGRRTSMWSRAWLHPSIAGLIRFQAPTSRGHYTKLPGQKWKPLWYIDQTEPDPDIWVERMEKDHVTDALLKQVSIGRLSKEQALRIRGEISRSGISMAMTLSECGSEKLSGLNIPPTRSACDPHYGPCPFQHACWSENPAEVLENSGLYQIRKPQPLKSRTSSSVMKAVG